jgi:translation initiation factor 5
MTERLNIPRSVTDPHYRYKMPKLFIKEESRLNGVKTNISNVNDVASALRVPAGVIIKFFCAETGTNAVKDGIIMGSHSQEAL